MKKEANFEWKSGETYQGNETAELYQGGQSVT